MISQCGLLTTCNSIVVGEEGLGKMQDPWALPLSCRSRQCTERRQGFYDPGDTSTSSMSLRYISDSYQFLAETFLSPRVRLKEVQRVAQST